MRSGLWPGLGGGLVLRHNDLSGANGGVTGKSFFTGGCFDIYRRHGAGQRWIERVEADRLRASEPSRSTTESADPIDNTRAMRFFAEKATIGQLLFRLKDIKGLSHIAVLLRHPGEDFHVLNLNRRKRNAG